MTELSGILVLPVAQLHTLVKTKEDALCRTPTTPSSESRETGGSRMPEATDLRDIGAQDTNGPGRIVSSEPSVPFPRPGRKPMSTCTCRPGCGSARGPCLFSSPHFYRGTPLPPCGERLLQDTPRAPPGGDWPSAHPPRTAQGWEGLGPAGGRCPGWWAKPRGRETVELRAPAATGPGPAGSSHRLGPKALMCSTVTVATLSPDALWSGVPC